MASVVPAAAATAILLVMVFGFIGLVWLLGYMTPNEVVKPTGALVSAFRSQRWWSLACSFYAAAFGASALVANPEAGATGGWLQVFCYGCANGLPYFTLAILGPKVQDFLGDDGFTVADFVKKRYGLLMFIPSVTLSTFFLFIWLTAELTSIADSFSLLSPDFYAPAAVLVIGIGVAVYALFAGFKGSIFTDRIQGAMALICVIILSIAVWSYIPTKRTAWEELNQSWSMGSSICGGLVLILSTTLNQFLDLGSWQRVFASEDHTQARIGLLAAGGVNFFCQSLMTFMGIYAMAAAFSGEIDIAPGDEALGFYTLLAKIPLGFNVVALSCVVVLAVSTVDSIENSLASALADTMIKRDVSLNWSRGFTLCLIALSMALATTRQSVLTLFLLSNIFASCIIPPIFIGLIPNCATAKSAFTGFISAVLTIFVIGWSVERDFVEGLKWPLFPRGFNHWTTLLTFLVCPCLSGFITMVMPLIESKGEPADIEVVAVQVNSTSSPAD